jgi:hypothetical protein
MEVWMSIKSISLRKLIKILFLPANRRVSEIRKDIREEISRNQGSTGGGGDFYAPFWSDAKNHVFGFSDLHASVADRIASNDRRGNLYPRLRDGFLLWWDQRRRWTNEPFRQAQSLRARFPFPGIAAIVKIDSILSVKDARNADRYIYPYFAPEPELTDEAARLSLWLLCNALPNVPVGELHVFDVIRGQTFSIDSHPLRGNEEQVFKRRYEALIVEWDTLRKGYP